MAGHLLQRLHMALARHVDALGAWLPPGQFQQFTAQRIQPGAGFGGQHQPGSGQRGVAGVGFVPDIEYRHAGRHLARHGRCNGCVAGLVVGGIGAGQVVQKQHGIGAFNRVPGAFNAYFFHLVGTLAQAGGVHHMHRHAFNLNGLLHFVARGAGNGRDDGQLGPGQRVEQGRLASVGLPGNHHFNALAQQRTLVGALRHGVQTLLQALQLALGIGLAQEINLFFREIQRRLHQHAQVNQGVAQLVNFLRERTGQRAAGAARGGLRAGINQVGNRLGLGQVDFVVEKSAF